MWDQHRLLTQHCSLGSAQTHDLRHPVQIILMNNEHLLLRLPLQPQSRRLLLPQRLQQSCSSWQRPRQQQRSLHRTKSEWVIGVSNMCKSMVWLQRYPHLLLGHIYRPSALYTIQTWACGCCGGCCSASRAKAAAQSRSGNVNRADMSHGTST